jgi:hypothetical protein
MKKPGKTKAFFICVLIASFLWLIHALNTVYTETFKIDVSFTNVPLNRQSLDPLPERLSIDIKASGLKLALLRLNKPFKPLEIDFNALKPLNHSQAYVLSASKLKLTDLFKLETQIKHISPDTIYFKEKTGFQKTVPIRVPIFASCMPGFACEKPVLQPAFVTIWGDSLAIKNTDTIYTDDWQVNKLQETQRITLKLLKPNENIYTGVAEVSVELPVSRLVEYHLSLPLQCIHHFANHRLMIYPPSVDIRFTALQNRFDLSDTALFKALIDENSPKKKNGKYPVFLGSIPGDITIMDIQPKEVEAYIIKK